VVSNHRLASTEQINETGIVDARDFFPGLFAARRLMNQPAVIENPSGSNSQQPLRFSIPAGGF